MSSHKQTTKQFLEQFKASFIERKVFNKAQSYRTKYTFSTLLCLSLSFSHFLSHSCVHDSVICGNLWRDDAMNKAQLKCFTHNENDINGFSVNILFPRISLTGFTTLTWRKYQDVGWKHLSKFNNMYRKSRIFILGNEAHSW